MFFDTSVQDPRGSRADAGQGNEDLGGLPECFICGKELPGFDLPDHFIEEHAEEVDI